MVGAADGTLSYYENLAIDNATMTASNTPRDFTADAQSDVLIRNTGSGLWFLYHLDGTTRISFLQEGRVDMSIASMNHTRKRDDAIDFSITYFWDNQSFLIRKGSYGSIDELIGQKVAANAGSSVISSWQAYSAAAGGPEPEIVEFDDKLAAMQALRDGAVEGYSEDNITLLSLVLSFFLSTSVPSFRHFYSLSHFSP